MQTTDQLIDEIVRSSQIPSGKRRQEVVRELRSHVEDFVLIARRAGRGDDEIQRLVVANFGDPRQIARQFAWVYRRERAILHLSVFLISTLVVAILISAAVIAAQAGMAIGLGVPVLRAFSSRHTMIEALDILATVAAYVGFISLEKLFDSRRFLRALAVLALVFAILVAGFAAAGPHPQFLLFGFANGAVLRMIQIFVIRPAARLAAALVCFGLIASVFFHGPFAALTLGSWLVMGAAYQAMTQLAARVDRALFNGLQRL